MLNIQPAVWNNTSIIQRNTLGANYPKEITDLVKEK